MIKCFPIYRGPGHIHIINVWLNWVVTISKISTSKKSRRNKPCIHRYANERWQLWGEYVLMRMNDNKMKYIFYVRTKCSWILPNLPIPFVTLLALLLIKKSKKYLIIFWFNLRNAFVNNENKIGWWQKLSKALLLQ